MVVGLDQLGDAQLLAGHIIGHRRVADHHLERDVVLALAQLFLDGFQAGLHVQLAPDHRVLDHFELLAVVVEGEARVLRVAQQLGGDVGQEGDELFALRPTW